MNVGGNEISVDRSGGWGMVRVWCFLGKVRYELNLINKLGPGEISASGKKLLQWRKERETKRGKMPGRKSRVAPGKAEQSGPRVDP